MTRKRKRRTVSAGARPVLQAPLLRKGGAHGKTRKAERRAHKSQRHEPQD